jgi:hypothetical protein
VARPDLEHPDGTADAIESTQFFTTGTLPVLHRSSTRLYYQGLLAIYQPAAAPDGRFRALSLLL